MSDAQSTEQQPSTPAEQYTSQIDPLFSAAWNDVFAPKEDKATGESGAETDAAAGGDPASASSDKGAGAGTGAEDAQAGGAESGAGDTAGSTGTAPDPTAGQSDADKGATDAGTLSPEAPLLYADVAPSFATASNQITERMESSFKTSALAEVREKIDAKYFEALEKIPAELVGQKVPSVKPGEPDILLRDSQDARDWQKRISELLEAEVDDVIDTKRESVKQITSVEEWSATY